jgi:hypothetical protein
MSYFRLRGLFRLRLLGRAQTLDALPDPADGCLVVLELLHPGNTRQTVPDGYQPVGRPLGGQFGQFLLVGEAVERAGGCGGGLLGGAVRRDVVFAVDG